MFNISVNKYLRNLQCSVLQHINAYDQPNFSDVTEFMALYTFAHFSNFDFVIESILERAVHISIVTLLQQGNETIRAAKSCVGSWDKNLFRPSQWPLALGSATHVAFPHQGGAQAQAKLIWAGVTALPSPSSPGVSLPLTCLPYLSSSNNRCSESEPM